MDSDEELSKQQQELVDGAVKKKMGDVMSSIRVVKSGGNYAFIQWSDDYQRTTQEEKAWKKIADANATILAIVAVGEVYAAVGLQAEEGGAAAAASAEAVQDESDSGVTSGSASKKQRRSSGAGATDKAIEGFATVMSAFLPPRPPPPPAPLTWAVWAKKCALTDEQKAAVLSCLPDPEPDLLACFDPIGDLQQTCKLKQMQLNCWAKLASGT